MIKYLILAVFLIGCYKPAVSSLPDCKWSFSQAELDEICPKGPFVANEPIDEETWALLQASKAQESDCVITAESVNDACSFKI